MHRNTDQHALAAAIRRADMRLRRALVIHLPDLLWSIAINHRIFTSVKRGLIQRAERRLRMLCAVAKPGGPAQAAHLAAVQTMDDAAMWVRA
jgi:hypothetical protein